MSRSVSFSTHASVATFESDASIVDMWGGADDVECNDYEDAGDDDSDDCSDYCEDRRHDNDSDVEFHYGRKDTVNEENNIQENTIYATNDKMSSPEKQRDSKRSGSPSHSTPPSVKKSKPKIGPAVAAVPLKESVKSGNTVRPLNLLQVAIFAAVFVLPFVCLQGALTLLKRLDGNSGKTAGASRGESNGDLGNMNLYMLDDDGAAVLSDTIMEHAAGLRGSDMAGSILTP